MYSFCAYPIIILVHEIMFPSSTTPLWLYASRTHIKVMLLGLEGYVVSIGSKVLH